MTPGRQTFVVALALIAAAVLQGRLAHIIAIKGAQPDFPLIVLACGATLIGGSSAIGLAVWAGLLEATMFGMWFGSVLTSRTLAGAFAGSLQRSVIRDSVVVPPLVVLATTVVAEFVFAAMVPSSWLHHVHRWARNVMGEIVYNTVLSHPVYLVLRRLHVGQPRENSFARVPK
jgi:rod shape-determining protein MreD